MFIQTVLRPHQQHNPDCNIIEGHLNQDAYLCYGEYINNPRVKFVEYYSGKNYKLGSGKRSHSRRWVLSETDPFSSVPKVWREAAQQLQKLHTQNFKP